jgi:hypothetical protein
MKIYKTQQEVEKDIKDGVLAIEGDVRFECSISISASIKVTFGNINAEDITARDITARDITARDINARNITARDINAGDINAWDINAGNILYYAFCCVYKSIKCFSIKAKRDIHQEPICLEGKVEIKDKKPKSLLGKIVEVKIDDKSYKAKIIEE